MKLVIVFLVLVLIVCGVAEIGLWLAAMQVTALGEPIHNLIAYAAGIAVIILAALAGLVRLATVYNRTHVENGDVVTVEQYWRGE